MKGKEKIFNVIDNEVWLKNCLRCKCPLENDKGERLFCWDCWIYLKDDGIMDKQLKIDAFYLMQHDKKIGNIKKFLIQPSYLPIKNEEIFYEDPFQIITYKSRTKTHLKSITICFKLTGNSIYTPTISIKDLENKCSNTKIEDALPINTDNFLMKRFGRK